MLRAINILISMERVKLHFLYIIYTHLNFPLYYTKILQKKVYTHIQSIPCYKIYCNNNPNNNNYSNNISNNAVPRDTNDALSLRTMNIF